MKQLIMTREMPRLSLRAKILATVTALVAAVALPQICHVAGAALGVGTGIGEMLLPMHLPILLVGLLAGPTVGAVAGLLAPLVSFMLSGMPLVNALPFMCIELAVYGLCTGALRSVKLPTVLKVIAAQLVGRTVRFFAMMIAAAGGHTALSAVSVWQSVKTGWVGLAIQLILIPIVALIVEKAQNNEK